ncbi:PEP-CTERM sorting domain-containing protein [Cerasicoccus fimbriatus]|uniref:PEP-CTERM sorting domain-containing protein n=1 Tax=Cerasicoccus fimbriatus TaxID=3014554 RepID=UPI0022B33647|nr:PEP-CTERM sorting domain-containing protein [Cerasicoccus sp. TK19100]
MKKHIIPIILLSLVSTAQAALTIYIYDTGPNLGVTATGQLDLTGLTYSGTLNSYSGDFIATAGPNVVNIALGASFDFYTDFISYPANFGAGVGSVSGPGAVGDTFFVQGDEGGGFTPFVGVPVGYSSAPYVLNFSKVYSGQSIASLMAVPGTYSWIWGADSVNVLIGTTPPITPVPEPAAIISMIGFSSLAGILWMRRKRKSKQSA